VIAPLTEMGAELESTGDHAPLTVHGKSPLTAITYTLPKPSAQVKSCVLLAGLFADGKTTVVETVPTRDHTERMLRHFGGTVEINGENISVNGDAELKAKNFTVPADISSAAFFMVAAACLPGAEIELKDLGLNPSRSEIVTVMRSLGADIEIANETGADGEPIGDVIIRGGLKQTSGANLIDGKQTAALIDEIPILAVFGTQLENGLEIRDAQELRIKESDRIKSVVANLKLMSAEVEEFEDGLRVGRSNLTGAKVDSYGDHRIAMAFAVAGIFADGETEIIDPECCGISFPGFFPMLDRLQK
jgi:3-phosphoshikimate 1-carboxyvinyltransferase